jgi:hypothetical protein
MMNNDGDFSKSRERQSTNLVVGKKSENRGGSPMKRLLWFGVQVYEREITKIPTASSEHF